MSKEIKNFDLIDLEILNQLQIDASISNAELAQKIGLSASACLNRTKILKDKGIIKQITAIIDEKKFGLEILTFTFVNLSHHNRKSAEIFVNKINQTPQVIECYNITGNWDYLLKIAARSISTYRDFVMDYLIEIPGVNKIETLFVLKSEKQNGILPLSTNDNGGNDEKI